MRLQDVCEMGPWSWALDSLHIVDYHGVAGHVVGNVLCDIVRDDELRTGLQANTLARL